jgi:hypothetical protein
VDEPGALGEGSTVMATVMFSPFIQYHVRCPAMEVHGDTVRDLLDQYFREHRRARGCILDERGQVRPRLAVFVDGDFVQDRIGLSDPVHARARVQVQELPLDTEYIDD